jgi:hypothetical protein
MKTALVFALLGGVCTAVFMYINPLGFNNTPGSIVFWAIDGSIVFGTFGAMGFLSLVKGRRNKNT